MRIDLAIVGAILSVVTGVVTRLGNTYRCKAVVTATGTFLHGLLHYGLTHFSGGRNGDPLRARADMPDRPAFFQPGCRTSRFGGRGARFPER